MSTELHDDYTPLPKPNRKMTQDERNTFAKAKLEHFREYLDKLRHAELHDRIAQLEADNAKLREAIKSAIVDIEMGMSEAGSSEPDSWLDHGCRNLKAALKQEA